jgi:hypothetical protein
VKVIGVQVGGVFVILPGVGAAQLTRSSFATGVPIFSDFSVEGPRRVGFCHYCPGTQDSLPAAIVAP